MTAEVEGRAAFCLDSIVQKYRVAFTRYCTCGDPECATPRIADEHDYRVLSCSMAAAIGLVRMLLSERDVDSAKALASVAYHWAAPALAQALEEDEGETNDLFARILAACSTTEAAVALSFAEAQIHDEMLETSSDREALTLDPEEIDRLWAAEQERKPDPI